MGKTPYLFRRKNVFYFRIRVPVEHQKTLNTLEIVQSLRTENQFEAIPQALKLAANFKAILHALKTGKKQKPCRSEVMQAKSEIIAPVKPSSILTIKTFPPEVNTKGQASKLSIVVNDLSNKLMKPSSMLLLRTPAWVSRPWIQRKSSAAYGIFCSGQRDYMKRCGLGAKTGWVEMIFNCR